MCQTIKLDCVLKERVLYTSTKLMVAQMFFLQPQMILLYMLSHLSILLVAFSCVKLFMSVCQDSISCTGKKKYLPIFICGVFGGHVHYIVTFVQRSDTSKMPAMLHY